MTFKTTARFADGSPASCWVAANIQETGQSFVRNTDGNGYADLAIFGAGNTPGFHVTFTSNLPIVSPQYAVVTADDQVVPMTMGFKRPGPTRHSPLPAFDQSDSGGEVHTTPPPELVIPPAPDTLFMRADFNGVTLDTGRWGGNPPFLVGANSTPLNMLMTPMAPMYPRKWQDAMLTEHAERNYSHFVIASGGWNFAANGYNPSPQDVANWARYVKSWGFKVVHWGNCQADDPMLSALLNAGAVDFHIIGEECDGRVSPGELDAIVANNMTMCGSVPCAVHFTSNWPVGFPHDTYMTSWPDGLHLCWQADQRDSSGRQGAMLYYARMWVNLGWRGESTFVAGAPSSRVYAFETMASAQLVGQCTEEYGCLRSLELLYTTRTDPRVLPVSGSGNGLRYPDGSWV